MHLSLQTFRERETSVADLLAAALNSPQAVSDLLPDAATDDPVLRELQCVRSAGPLLLDLQNAEEHLSDDEVSTIVQVIRDHWHCHGFCLARSADLRRWARAAYDHQQPLLVWRSISRHGGYDLLGTQLRAPALDVFRLLVNSGRVTVEEVATNPTIFSQHPNYPDWRVQRDIALHRNPHGPIEFNRSQAALLLTQMHRKRLVVGQGNAYDIVRPNAPF